MSLPPLQHKASVVDKTNKKESERGGTSDCKKRAWTCTNPLQDRILEVQQCRGVPSRKQKTGTTVLVLTSHLPSASSKSTDLTDQASFPSTDTVITTKTLVLTAAEQNRQCMPVDLLHDEGRSRASWSCAIFLLAPQGERARVTMMYTRGQAHLDAILSLFALAQTSPSLHIHFKWTSMCGFSLNPPPPPLVFGAQKPRLE